MPGITVTVPVYRVEPYLRRCVDSLLSGQTHADLELVLVDDGSPDGCAAICDGCAAEDERALVVHQRNGGLSAARNAGIDWATACSDSKWLAFVDSDDWVHPRYLEWLLRAAEEQSTRVAVCKYAEVESYEPPAELEFESERVPWDELFVNDNVTAVVAWNKLYAKELFEGLRYPVGRIHEDEFLTYKLLHRAGDVALVQVVLYSYYQNPSGIMGGRFTLRRLDAIDAFAEQVAYVHENGLHGLEEWVVRRYFSECISRTRMLVDASYIFEKLREKEKARIVSQARAILFRYGLPHLSLLDDYDYYAFVLPHFIVRAVRAPLTLPRRLRKTAATHG